MTKKYKEWQSNQNGSAWKTQIRKDINFCIKSASTYEEFLLLMRAKGYEIKGETFEEGAAKYISFRPLDKERFVRGSTRSLGKEYTKERIKERIERKRERKAVIPKGTTLPAGSLTPRTRNLEAVRDCKGGLPLRI